MILNNPPKSVRKLPSLLIQTHDLSLSGVPIIAHDHAVDLEGKGFFVVMASASSGRLLEFINTEKIPVFISSAVLDSPEEIDKFLLNFDGIIVNTILSWRLVLIANKLDIPVLWIIQEGDFGVQKVRENNNIQAAINIADKVVFSSKQTLRKYKEFCKEKNCTTMFFGVEPPNGIQNSTKRNTDKKLRIVHIGSVEHRKGQDILIQAIITLPEKIKNNIEISFIGRILDDEFYQNQLEQSLNIPNLSWLGSLPQAKVWSHLMNCDILICSSRDETGPLVVYEAMSLGKVVISTPVGAVPEIIKHNKNGLVFKEENQNELATFISELSLDRARVERLGKKAYKTYKKKLTKKISNEKIFKMISNIIRNKSK
jgi:O-antigen biosynthesis protein